MCFLNGFFDWSFPLDYLCIVLRENMWFEYENVVHLEKITMKALDFSHEPGEYEPEGPTKRRS